jgi:kynurenine 3-monooxygenase
MSSPESITISGAGPAGSLMAILLGKRNIPVRVLERRPDPFAHPHYSGRSINLALADRGIHALKQAGVFEAIEPLMIPMLGRCIHELNGQTQFIPYSQHQDEVIYSISRNALNDALLRHAKQLCHVDIQYSTACNDMNFEKNELVTEDTQSKRQYTQPFSILIAADGAHSPIRQALTRQLKSNTTIDLLPHGYKELTLPASVTGQYQLDPHALHIWPRGGFMLIALPNIDGSFTVTLFLSINRSDTAPESFQDLKNKQEIDQFFLRHFPDAAVLMPNLAEQFMTNPTGKMSTVYTPTWTTQNIVLIGDAAHAIVPFHGQGMNCAFEDCIGLDQLMQQHDHRHAFALFEKNRRPNAEAIAMMALENYIEMRDTVRHPQFQLQKTLSFQLEALYPKQFIPRYSMVMFHHDISYATAYQRGQIQQEILDQLTRDAATLDQVDLKLAERLIQSRLPTRV